MGPFPKVIISALVRVQLKNRLIKRPTMEASFDHMFSFRQSQLSDTLSVVAKLR